MIYMGNSLLVLEKSKNKNKKVKMGSVGIFMIDPESI